MNLSFLKYGTLAAVLLCLSGCVGSSAQATNRVRSGIIVTQTPQPDVGGVKQPDIVTTDNYFEQDFFGRANNERGAVTPPVINVPGSSATSTTYTSGVGNVIAGAAAKVSQLVKQLDYVIWSGVLLIFIGVGLFIGSWYVPGISQSMSFYVAGAGVCLFFIPTIVVKAWWILLILGLAGFGYFWWQNTRLIKKGVSVGAGIAPVPMGMTKEAVIEASGSGILDMVISDEITPPTTKKGR